jgi:site-specific DNA-cytosine methylase
MERTHASFFSGVGGLDLGLERAGWRTVSLSEVDPYASAVLAERWHGVPNLGDIVQLAGSLGSGTVDRDGHGAGSEHQPDDWRAATLWTGGFPCQDLSVAGKRRGMGAGTRSGLAYSFLALAERYRPRFVLLENVPGLLSSHGGRDMAALLGALVELGYGVGYRILDARYFGVPQRRRRVFILGDSLGGRAGAERASEVLSVGSRCGWHPPAGRDTGEESPRAAARRAVHAGELVGTIDGGFGHHGGAIGGDNIRQGHIITPGHQTRVSGPVRTGNRLTRQELDDIPSLISTRAPDDARGEGGWREGSAAVRGHEPDPRYVADADPVRQVVGPSPDTSRDGAPDGLAGRLDDRPRAFMENQRGELRLSDQTDSVKVGGGKPGQGYQAVLSGTIREHVRPGSNTDHSLVGRYDVADDPLLPIGLDSHRYRCCGNGVVSSVAEFIGERLAAIA